MEQEIFQTIKDLVQRAVELLKQLLQPLTCQCQEWVEEKEKDGEVREDPCPSRLQRDLAFRGRDVPPTVVGHCPTPRGSDGSGQLSDP